MKNKSNINGILVINKPASFTSRDVVNKISKILGTKKVGHTGTLDPIAKGVLVIVLGKYTKLCDVLTTDTKEYIAEFTLGYETDTLDITGTKTKESSNKVTEEEITKIIKSFIGSYMQEVPIYSAVKIDGKRLYEYARHNQSITLPKREVNIYSLDILSIKGNKVTIKCSVSKGTYIRSLIRDIGVELNTYATMDSLVRTKQGKFDIESSYTIEDIENNNYILLNIKQAIANLETIELSSNLEKMVLNGVPLELNSNNTYVLFTKENEEIALYKKDGNLYKMFIKLI